MKYYLLTILLLFSFPSASTDTSITPQLEGITYRGEFIKYIDVAFDDYLNQISDTKYKFRLLKENYIFNLTINGNAVVVKIFFNSKEFREKTGKDVFGGGGEFVIAKDLGTIRSSKLYR
ncbi:hypothetical protein [Colwellia piezophila]|uniref:hypothetical protein n=1 Tax=Colwellia piezophila TaxID=211668 RepID=UPI000360059B|nr:hypothetical protein [Colwellia piezophila]